MVNNPRAARAPLSSPEVTADQLEEMLAELDALCRQAREITSSLTRQMAEQKQDQQQVLGPQRFPTAVTRR